MIERLQDMSEGAIGFEFAGDVTGDECRQVLEPPLEEAVRAGEVALRPGRDEDLHRGRGGDARSRVAA
jgi:hypothetical protein